MIKFWLFFTGFCLASPSYAFYPWTSQSSYRLHTAQKADFERQQKLFLIEQNLQNLLLKDQKKNREQAYLLEFYSQKDRNSDRQKQQALKTPEELAYLRHQNRNKAVENLRDQAFLEYKKNHQAYQKKQQKILSSRLRKLKVLRQKAPFDDPVF